MRDRCNEGGEKISLFHDPIRHAGYLRQSLATDKMPIGLFLGAGCPLSIKTEVSGTIRPLIPDISGLTKLICDKGKCDEIYKKSFSTLMSHFETDGQPNPTIEDILSHLRALHQVAGNETVRGLNSSELFELDQMICNEISNLMTKTLPDCNTPYPHFVQAISVCDRFAFHK